MALSELPANKAILLNNATCPYCGIELTRDNDTKEHVIGRRFVPKGSLNGQWNLIIRACSKCNSIKSDLENDISAITLASRVWFSSTDTDKSIMREVQRKVESSISRKTGKPVKHSQEELNFETPFSPGGTIRLNLVAPPQLDDHRLFELARMQMMAFFYFITFNQESNKGGFWPEGFHPISEVTHDDWGNSHQKAFMHAVQPWEPHWIGNTADGFFKSLIRKHPHEECWSWALEWNRNYRLVGFFGAREPAQAIVNTFPPPEMVNIPTGNKRSLRIRKNIRLEEHEDLLFVWDDSECDNR